MKTLITGWLFGIGFAVGVVSVVGWILFFMRGSTISILKGVWL